MTDGPLNYYHGAGTNAERLAFTPDPPTPGSGPPLMLYDWWETDTKTFWVYDVTDDTWYATGGGGGYSPGSPPTFVQVAFSTNGGNSATFGAAPTNGNYLVAMIFNPTSPTAGAGWTQEAGDSSGTDYGYVLTKTAGAGESTTQSPITGNGGTGAIVIWELHGQNGTTPFIYGASEIEQTAAFSVPVLVPNLSNCIGLAAVGVVPSPTISALYNVGVQDVLSNTNTRYLGAGHTDLSKTPMAGVLASFSSSASHKCVTALISS
jgi:hypothetical protein